jgi:hypothetical protein
VRARERDHRAGTTFEAPIVRRLAAPVVPSAIETVPDEIVYEAKLVYVQAL